jgi:hypothetical protein
MPDCNLDADSRISASGESGLTVIAKLLAARSTFDLQVATISPVYL